MQDLVDSMHEVWLYLHVLPQIFTKRIILRF